MVRRVLYILLALSMSGSSAHSFAQTPALGNQDSVMTGPYGVPRLVLNEGGAWEEPIKVYEDSQVQIYVPDLTSPGWAQWHVAEYRERRTYFTYLYIYGRAERTTLRELINVDMSAKTVTVQRPLLPPIHSEIASLPRALAQSIARITTIIQDESDRFRGPTIQEFVKDQEKLSAQMARCVDDLSGCDTPAPGQLTALNDDSISPPKLLRAPVAELTAAARRAGVRGTVSISVMVDAAGHTKDIQVLKSLGYGLDESAVEAVRHYTFLPAFDLKTGKPVGHSLKIDLKFE